MKKSLVILYAVLMLALVTGCGSGDSHVEYESNSPVSCDHYYWGASCMECLEQVESFDGVNGEFYGILRDWQADAMTVELTETDASYMADSRQLTKTGIVHTFALEGARYSLDYRWLDGGYYEGEFDSVDALLDYTPKYPRDQRYAGRSVEKSLGDNIGICFPVEDGVVLEVVVMYP